MKAEQEKKPFVPFKLTFETREEALALAEMVDWGEFQSKKANKLANEISDMFSNMEIVI